MKKSLLASLFLVVLSGCLMVADLGKYWDQGTIDPALKGKWLESSSKEKITMKQDGDRYLFSREKSTDTESVVEMKTLTINGHKFIMMHSPHGNGLFKYTTEMTDLTLYSIKDDKYAEFKKEYHGSNVSRDKYTGLIIISVLNEETIKIIAEISSKKDYWTEFANYERL